MFDKITLQNKVDSTIESMNCTLYEECGPLTEFDVRCIAGQLGELTAIWDLLKELL